MKGDIHRVRVVEAIGILRWDAGMSMRAIEHAGIVKERSMRSWIAGKDPQRISDHHIEALEEAVQARGLVPWCRHYFPMSDAMWETAGAGGKNKVVRSIQSEKARLRKRLGDEPEDRSAKALHEALADAEDALRRAEQKNPLMAQEAQQEEYLFGAAIALERRFGGYAAMLTERFHKGLPNPAEASPQDWSGVLHLLQFLRDTKVLRERGTAENTIYTNCVRWLRHVCSQFNQRTWARVVALHVAETELIASWEKVASVEGRTELLTNLRWFKLQRDYHERVEGNHRAVRNALATASATLQRDRYAELHRMLAAHDEAWRNPRRMQAFGKLDSDFDDFIAWADGREEVWTVRKGIRQEMHHDDR